MADPHDDETVQDRQEPHPQEAPGEGFAAVEKAFEGDGPGGRAVVKEDGDAAAVVCAPAGA